MLLPFGVAIVYACIYNLFNNVYIFSISFSFFSFQLSVNLCYLLNIKKGETRLFKIKMQVMEKGQVVGIKKKEQSDI